MYNFYTDSMTLTDKEQEELLDKAFDGKRIVLWLFLFPIFVSVSEKGLRTRSLLRTKFYYWEQMKSAETWHYYFGGSRGVGDLFAIRFFLKNGKLLRLPGMNYEQLHPIKKIAKKHISVFDQTGKENIWKNKQVYLKWHFITALVVVTAYCILRYIIFPT